VFFFPLFRLDSGLILSDYFHVYVTFAFVLHQTSLVIPGASRREIVSNDGNFADGQTKFESVLQVDVPKGRDGKHKSIITRLLGDIAQLSDGAALKIPLSQLPDTKENIRSALSRAARQANINLATSSNDEFLYVWKSEK
jgi:hypothetical protein